MLVSLIIPNYNKAPFLKDTLLSIITQTYTNWELVIVDDGSTDGSQEILKEFATIDHRIRFIRREREPKGGSVCRNIGIEHAQGKYLMLFDSDDLMSPQCLQQRVEYMMQHPKLHFAVFPVGTFYKEIGDNSMVWRPHKGNHLKAFLQHNLPWNIMSPLWQTSFVKESLNGFDEVFPRLQDVEFHTRALLIQNVQYAIEKNLSPECFYRIDHSRNKLDHLQMLKVMQPGIEMYIKKFGTLIDKPLRKYLRGTLFSFLTQVNYYKASKWISDVDYLSLIEHIKDTMKESDIFTSNSKKTVNYYNILYPKGRRIKGFNFFAKYFFIIN